MMKDAGLLTVDAQETFQELLMFSDQGMSMFRIDTMTEEILSNPKLTSAKRATFLDTITSLDTFDKEFNRQFMLDHRVLDSATSEHAASKMLYAYRNFPVNFTINRTLRDSSTMSPAGWMAKQLKHLILDIIYMHIIQIAAGRDPAELIKEWEENPWWNLARYASRVPVAGPWGGVAAQISVSAAMQAAGHGTMMDPSTGPISVSALNSFIRTLGKAFTAGESQDWWETGIGISRVIPFAGGAMTRAVGQIVNNWAHGGPMGRARGGGGGGSSISPQMGTSPKKLSPSHPKRLLPSPIIGDIENQSILGEYWKGSPMEQIFHLINNDTGDLPATIQPPNPSLGGAIGRLGGKDTEDAASEASTDQTTPTLNSQPKPAGKTSPPSVHLPTKDHIGNIVEALGDKEPKRMPEGIA